MGPEREPLPTRVRDTPPLPPSYERALVGGTPDPWLGSVLADPAVRAVIDGHVRLLLAWTPHINLTAIREPAAVATAHVLDSLSALPWLRDRRADRVLDLGSGGGYPGLPLAAALPDSAFTLVEPIAKKARFLQTVVEATGLADRVTVLTARAEELAAATVRRRFVVRHHRSRGGVDRRPRRARLPVAGPRRVAGRLEARRSRRRARVRAAGGRRARWWHARGARGDHGGTHGSPAGDRHADGRRPRCVPARSGGSPPQSVVRSRIG